MVASWLEFTYPETRDPLARRRVGRLPQIVVRLSEASGDVVQRPSWVHSRPVPTRRAPKGSPSGCIHESLLALIYSRSVP